MSGYMFNTFVWTFSIIAYTVYFTLTQINYKDICVVVIKIRIPISQNLRLLINIRLRGAYPKLFGKINIDIVPKQILRPIDRTFGGDLMISAPTGCRATPKSIYGCRQIEFFSCPKSSIHVLI